MKSSMGMKDPSSRFLIFSSRFTLLLVSIVITFALGPFLEGYASINLLTDICLSAILLAAIPAVSDKRSTFYIALAFACPYLILKWGSALASFPLPWNFEEIFGALFVSYVLVLILSFIARQRKVSRDVIMAAVCGYFLLGLMWGFIYFFVESLLPGSFQFALDGQGKNNLFIYFSFVTMTTVGYGDMLPLSNAARSLAILEAVMGQLYLAVTIARLVGMQSSQAQSERHEDSDAKDDISSSS